MATNLNEKFVQYAQLSHFKTKQDEFNAGLYAKKADLTTVFRYKGTVDTFADLPASDQVVGDTYNVVAADVAHNVKAGDNVVWNGTDWDVLSGIFDINAAVKVQAETMTAGTKVATITIDGVPTEINVPKVTATATDTAGYKAATISVNGTDVDVYVPVCTDDDIDAMFAGA